MSGRLELATLASSLFGNNIAHSLSKHLLSALMLAFMLVCGGTAWGKTLNASFETPASNGAWDSENNKYTWTGGSNNLMPIFTFGEGGMRDYDHIHMTFAWTGTGTYANAFRMVFIDAEENKLATIVFGSASEKNIDLITHESTRNINFSAVRKISVGGHAWADDGNTYSVTIDPATVYLTGQNTVTFGPNTVGWGTVTAKRLDTGTFISSGDKVPNGTHVQFAATASSATYLTWKFYDGKNSYYAAEKELVINDDINFVHEFTQGIHIRAYTNDADLGTVNIRRGSSNATEYHVTPWPGETTFIATTRTGGVFNGWYSNSEHTGEPISTEPSYTKTDITNVGVDLYAYFTHNGVNHTVTFSSNGEGTVSATVKGNPISSGDEVPEGSKVTFTGAPNTGKLFWLWRDMNIDDDQAQIKTGQGSPWTVTVTEDLNIRGDFNQANTYSVRTNNEAYGTVTIKQDGVDKGIDFQTTPYPQGMKCIATPKENCVFDGWYKDSGYTNKLSSSAEFDFSKNATSDLKGNSCTLYAKFSDSSLLIYNEELMCNHHQNSNTGDNYMNLTRINAGPNITYTHNPSTGGTITTTLGGYISFVFPREYNFSDLTSWEVHGAAANVGMVSFLDNDSEVATFYTNAGNRSNLEQENKNKLKAVKEIRIHFKPAPADEDSQTSTFDYIRFTFEHADRTLPTLTDGTEAEMEIYETQNLTITNSPGYWRQFTDDTFTEIKQDGIIPTNEWNTTYTFNNMKKGDYYFGARDGGTCALGYNHQTELTTMHVNVKAFDIYGDIVTTEDSAHKKSGSYVHPDLNLVYGNSIGDADVTVEINQTRNEWHSDCGKGVKFNRDWGTELKITAPNGYRIQKVECSLGHDVKYNVSFNYGNLVGGKGTSISWVNTTNDDNIRMVIRNEAADDEAEIHLTNVRVYLVPVDEKIINEPRQVSTTFDGNTETRDYWLYVPQNVKNGTNNNVPVVFALHGGSEDFEPTHNGQLNFNSLADQYNFVVVYPRAKEHLFPHFNANPARAWLATGGKNEDTEYFKAILNAIEHNDDGYTINKNRVYMAGFSVGGMMAYATANVLPDKFAAFASISGLPMNELHLRHHGAKPVPFLHVHGTKDSFVNYKYMPTIVDNMVARNGLSYTPTSVTHGTADIWGDVSKTTYTKSVYGPAGSKTPYIYYEVGTGMTSADTGMGHNHWCALDGVDVKKVMWDFLSQFNLTDTRDTNIEFAPQVNGLASGVHNGWRVNENNNLLQYGESGGYSATGQNVYHSLQLNEGTHYLNFTLSNDNTKNVNVRLYRIGALDAFDKLDASFSTDPKEIVNKNYKAGQSITIEFETEEAGEYQLIIVKENKYADISVTNLSITKTGTVKGSISDTPVSTDFGGYYNYNQRLFAQWNFDLCDGFRFNVKKLDIPTTWKASYRNTDTGNENVKNGTVVYTYVPAITPSSKTDYANYQELTYDGTNKIPALAGLKFMTEANCIEVHVDYQNGIINGTHLVVNENVKMIVPYVENSYRNDKGVTEHPEDNYDDFKNCMHHIKRDILYIALHEGSIWDGRHVISSECIDDVDAEHKTALFHNGGDEFVNGHSYNKGDYLGRPGTPCVLQFKGTTVFDRIGVNRNLTFSFYTEYISEYGVPKPTPRMRVIGSPTGLKVANASQSSATYEGAIAMTFGGWKNTDGNSNYEAYNQEQNKAEQAVSNATVTDMWSDLGVCIGEYPDKEKTFMTWGEAADYPVIGSVNTPMAADGFPVTSVSYQLAKSESLMPETTKGNKYHEACEGNFATSYTANYTPWTLPCRGAFVKFEPTLPGVLNVDVLQKREKKYYVVDEFGKPVENVFTKTATNGSTNTPDGNGGYTVTGTKDDYVKYCFNVYPGKTYYIFSNEHGMGLTGFYFEPYVYKYAAGSVPAGKTEEYARMDVGVKTLENDAPYVFNDANTTNAHLPEGFACGDTYVNIYSPDGNSSNVEYPIHYSEKAVKVRMNRAFKAGEWTSICFPFSLNQNMMEQIFGKGTKVILLRDIQNRTVDSNYHTVANFIMHENQDIIAGYPYLICPVDPIESGFTTTVCLYETTPGTPSISGTGFKTNVGSGDFGGDGDYTFKGSFGVQNVSKGSYLTSGGKLARAGSAGKIKGYRAFLEYSGSEENMLAKAITMFNLGDSVDDEYDQPTFIDGVQVDDYVSIRDTRNDNNVYNVHGQIVRRNTRNLVGLPKGAYIVNGKKHIVK